MLWTTVHQKKDHISEIHISLVQVYKLYISSLIDAMMKLLENLDFLEIIDHYLKEVNQKLLEKDLLLILILNLDTKITIRFMAYSLKPSRYGSPKIG